MKLPVFVPRFKPTTPEKRRLQFLGLGLTYGIAVTWWVLIILSAIHDINRLPFAISAGAILLCIPMTLEGKLQTKLRSDEALADARASRLAHSQYIWAKYYEVALPAINAFAKAVATATGEAARSAEQAFADATASFVKQRDDALAEVNQTESDAYEYYKKSVTLRWGVRPLVWLLGAGIGAQLAPYMVEYVVPLLQFH